MKVIHIKTQVVSILGLMDEDGNVVEEKQVQGDVRLLSPAAFAQTADDIARLRDEWQEQANDDSRVRPVSGRE